MDTNFSGMQSPTGQPAGSGPKLKWILIVVAALIVAAAAIWYFITSGSGKVLGVSTTSTYQSVFLTNGQVYFGKMTDEGSWIKLTDIYYLQVTQPLQQTANPDQTKPSDTASNSKPDIQLVKLGSELHGPTDAMYIEHDKVLFWENMKDDSKVVSAIKQYKSK